MNLVIDCFKLVKGEGKSIGIPHLAKSIVVNLGRRVLEERRREKAENQGREPVRIGGKPGRKGRSSVIVLGNVWNREEFDVPGVTFVEVPGDPRNKLYCVFWELVLVARYARKYAADRILFPRGYRPLGIFLGHGRRRIRDTILIHDLIPFYYDTHYPGVFHPLENAYIMRRLKDSIRGADRIITISDFSRRDILEKVPGCGKKIRVIYNGVNEMPERELQQRAQKQEQQHKLQEEKKKKRDQERMRKKTQTQNLHESQEKGIVPGKYMVAMTSGLPHKNAIGILRTYEAYTEQVADPLPLVVIGIGDTSAYRDMKKEAAAKVTCLSYIGDFKEMCRIAGGARVYLFLSYMEGFGFPPLEAMQLGVPVVCSNRSSLPEVVGDAGILVDPDDREAVVSALVRVSEEEKLRQEMIRKGYENIRRFSWKSRTDLYWKELFR